MTDEARTAENNLPAQLREWADLNMHTSKYGPGMLRIAADVLESKAERLAELERMNLEWRQSHGEISAKLHAFQDAQPPSDSLRDALVHAVSVIQTWHNMEIPVRSRSDLWDIYWKNSPEMKPIRAALTKNEGPACSAVPAQEVANQDITVSASRKSVESDLAPPSHETSDDMFTVELCGHPLTCSCNTETKEASQNALRAGLERAIEIVSAAETPSDYYNPYRDRLIELIDEAIEPATAVETGAGR